MTWQKKNQKKNSLESLFFFFCFCFISHRSDFISINDTVSKQHKTRKGICCNHHRGGLTNLYQLHINIRKVNTLIARDNICWWEKCKVKSLQLNELSQKICTAVG